MPIELTLQRMLLTRAATALPDVRMFRRNVMRVQTDDGRVVKNGIKGQADIHGYVKRNPLAIPFEVELKSAEGSLSPEQKAWAAFCDAWRVPYVVLQQHHQETLDETVNRWLSELRTWIDRLGR